MDDDSRIDYAAPPPLPAAPAKSNKAIWWILGGAAAIVVLSNLFWLWFFFAYLRGGDGPLLGPLGLRGGPGASGPVNQQPIDKGVAADASAYEAQVDGYLASLAGRYSGSGYTETFTSGKAALAGGGEAAVELELAADLQHVVFAVCDDDCTDLDLTLYDENDNVVDEDYAVDSEPVVEVVPAWSGVFTAKVDMVECLAEDCLYALAVYSRPAPAAGAAGTNPKSEP